MSLPLANVFGKYFASSATGHYHVAEAQARGAACSTVKRVGAGEQPEFNKVRVILPADKQGAVPSRKRKASQKEVFK